MIPLQTPSYTKLYNCLGINLNCAEKLTRYSSNKMFKAIEVSVASGWTVCVPIFNRGRSWLMCERHFFPAAFFTSYITFPRRLVISPGIQLQELLRTP